MFKNFFSPAIPKGQAKPLGGDPRVLYKQIE